MARGWRAKPQTRAELSAVTPKHIEEWLIYTDETTSLSRVTIIEILQAAKVAFAEAFRVGDIRAIPVP
jgi:hypothetical protein